MSSAAAKTATKQAGNLKALKDEDESGQRASGAAPACSEFNAERQQQEATAGTPKTARQVFIMVVHSELDLLVDLYAPWAARCVENMSAWCCHAWSCLVIFADGVSSDANAWFGARAPLTARLRVQFRAVRYVS